MHLPFWSQVCSIVEKGEIILRANLDLCSTKDSHRGSIVRGGDDSWYARCKLLYLRQQLRHSRTAKGYNVTSFTCYLGWDHFQTKHNAYSQWLLGFAGGYRNVQRLTPTNTTPVHLPQSRIAPSLRAFSKHLRDCIYELLSLFAGCFCTDNYHN